MASHGLSMTTGLQEAGSSIKRRVLVQVKHHTLQFVLRWQESVTCSMLRTDQCAHTPFASLPMCVWDAEETTQSAYPKGQGASEALGPGGRRGMAFKCPRQE